MEMPALDYGTSIPIADNIHWVGVGMKSFLNRNIYLRKFSGNGRTANMLIDPGPTVDFDVLSGKLTPLTGNIAKVHLAFINHQDPDVVGNLPYLAKLNPKIGVIATEDTWRLVSLSNLQDVHFHAIERFQGQQVKFPTGHVLKFVPTPFCHFRGACMLYDLESRILFTGDFFGGVAATDLYATSANWAGIKAFHQLYMPSNEAIRLAVQRIRDLEPAPLMLAPQHGGIIKGELIDDFLDRMTSLQVGLDILTNLKDKMPSLIAALNEINGAVAQVAGEEHLKGVMRMFQADGSYPSFFGLTKEGIVTEIKGEPIEAIESLIKCFFRGIEDQTKNILKSRFMKILIDRNLPPFDILIGNEEYEAIELSDGT